MPDRRLNPCKEKADKNGGLRERALLLEPISGTRARNGIGGRPAKPAAIELTMVGQYAGCATCAFGPEFQRVPQGHE